MPNRKRRGSSGQDGGASEEKRPRSFADETSDERTKDIAKVKMPNRKRKSLNRKDEGVSPEKRLKKTNKDEESEKRIQELEQKIKDQDVLFQSKLDELERKSQQEKEQLIKISKERDDALTRLSAIASSNLRDNNPNIADLSDVNRPTKLAEKMSELYDNEWTDAFDELEASMSDRKVIGILLKTLMDIFKACQQLATNNFFEKVQHAIENPVEGTECTNEMLPKEMKQQIKEFRKKRAPAVIDDVSKYLQDSVPTPVAKQGHYGVYFNKCVEIAWLSQVQDPPLNFVADKISGDSFDRDMYKDYTKRGPLVDYMVWPALLLHVNGPVLAKGVAQGCQKNSAE